MDYPSLKAQAECEWKALENLDVTLIQIGAGTCGLAAGADKVIERIEEAGGPGKND
jgi:hypothetical protein